MQVQKRDQFLLGALLGGVLSLGACTGDDLTRNVGIEDQERAADPLRSDSGTPDAGGPTDAAPDLAQNVANEPDASAAPDLFIEEIEVAGTWFASIPGFEIGEETVSSDAWSSPGFEQAVIEFDNEQNYAITQVPEDDAFNPNKFAKIVWTDFADDGSWFYCTAVFGQETAEDAKGAEVSADDSDPENGGCSGFSWTLMEPLQGT